MLASTVQFSTYDQTPAPLHRQTQPPHEAARRYDRQPALTREQRPPAEETPPAGSALSGPNSVPTNRTTRSHPVPHPPVRRRAGRTGSSHSRRPNWSAFHPRAPPRRLATRRSCRTVLSRRGSAPPAHGLGGEVLLRKEVIQPHLPVRLPCYDFVPIADPAFDGSLHKGWATGFGRYRLS